MTIKFIIFAQIFNKIKQSQICKQISVKIILKNTNKKLGTLH